MHAPYIKTSASRIQAFSTFSDFSLVWSLMQILPYNPKNNSVKLIMSYLQRED